MNFEEITATFDKLRYQIRILGSAIDYDKNPIEALIIGNDWDEKDLNNVHDIFERWDRALEQGKKMNSVEFEADFDNELGIGYQGLKPIVNSLYKNGQWTEVCEAYVDSFGQHPAMEYHAIMRRER